ncbi:hypothetical protein YC2023_017175 [Brassica napus]
MPFDENTFDGPYFIEATCHAPELEEVYAEIFRVMKPGSLYVSYEWVTRDREKRCSGLSQHFFGPMDPPRQRRGLGGTGSQSRDSSQIQDSASPHSSYHTSSSPFPASAPLALPAAPAPAPPGPPGVMSVAELVRQPGGDHLPYLTPYPHGGGQTWFNRSGNGISAWINRMMYSALDKGHPTFTDFPTEKQHLWFRQFAQEFNWNSDETLFIYHHFVHKVMDNFGKQIHEWKKKSQSRSTTRSGRSCVRIEIRKRRKKLLPPTPPTAGATVKGRASSSITWVLNLLPLWGSHENDGEPVDDLALMKRAYTNKKTGQIDDGLVREVITLVQTQVQDEVSQLQTEDDDSTASTNLSRRFQRRRDVWSVWVVAPGRFGSSHPVGLGRRTRSVPPSSAPPPFVDPEVLTAQLKDKDDRISLLETQMAAQQAGYEAQKRLNQQMMEMMQRMYPNEVFPNVQDP